MFSSFLKIAVRILVRERFYSFINIMGLAIGIASSLVILMYVLVETSYDKGFKDHDRIFRIGVSFANLGEFANAPEILKPYLDENVGIVDKTVRVRTGSPETIVFDDNSFNSGSIYSVDSTFFEVFNFKFLVGSSSQSLNNPNSIILSKNLAKRIFGTSSALNQTIVLGKDEEELTVTGVVDTDEFTHHFGAEAWRPIYNHLQGSEHWMSASIYTYVKLIPESAMSDLNEQLEVIRREVVYPYSGPEVSYDQWTESNWNFQFHTEQLADIHLKSELLYQMKVGGNMNNIYIFSIISALILLIAAVNYVNLTTARASRRSKEVGIKKSLGSSRYGLIGQFLTESVSICLIAMVLAFAFSEIFVMLFQSIAGYDLFANWNRLELLVLVTAISVSIGVLAGSYPAFYLSSFKPITILKAGMGLKAGSTSFGRNILVIIQFTISISLIICSILLFKQLEFLRNKDLGLTKENVVVVSNLGVLEDNVSSFKNKIEDLSYVSHVSTNGRVPGGSSMYAQSFKTAQMEVSKNYDMFPVDDAFLNALNIELIAGRSFNKELASDTASILINEAALRDLELGSPDSAIDVSLNGWMRIIGVVKNFNFEGFDTQVEPVVIMYRPENHYRLIASIELGREEDFTSTITSMWAELYPDEPVSYYFLEDNFEKLLAKEKVLGKSIGVFTILAIFISCLGLLGLAAYTAERRTKEMGVRKVLGATARNIIQLMGRGFLMPVLLSFFISIPITWMVLQKWLQQFAYKTEISLWIYLVSFAAAILLAWFTVLYFSSSVARANPVNSLREE